MTDKLNVQGMFAPLGASNHAKHFDRAEQDYYATDPKAVELLLEQEKFSPNVWECACGSGELSKVLEAHGHNVRSTDLIDRGFGQGGVDFLEQTEKFDGDIITNPPYKYAQQFVEHALDLITDGHRVAMFLKVLFLESMSRRKLFDRYPPHYVYVASKRIQVMRNGDWSMKNEKSYSEVMAFAWFIWDKPYDGETILRWFN